MSLNTRSKFYYGHYIDLTNNKLDFEDSAVREATLNVGDYTLTEFAAEVARAMNEVSNETYSISVNRTDRTLTISSTSNFSLLVTTGANNSTPWSLLGFTANQTGGNSYTGTASGTEFIPQFFLQRYIDFEDDQQSVSSNVAESASGQIQTVSFGTNKFATMEIKYQTAITQVNGAIENSTTGVTDLRNFMIYVTKKRKVEFMKDRGTPTSFNKCVLESTSSSSSGTGFRLKESLGSMPGYFSSGTLKFREV